MKVFLAFALIALSFSANKSAAESCLDFSGEWKGTCKTPDGVSVSGGIRIQQTGCASIRISRSDLPDVDYVFGIPKVTQTASMGDHYLNQAVVNWSRINGNGSSINVTYNNSSSRPDPNGDKGRLSGKAGYDVYSLAGTDLVVLSKVTYFGSEMETRRGWSFTCRFSK